jgi:hypothetical protein
VKVFEDGVRYYTTGTATITVGFPENYVCCRHCDRLISDSLRRPMCSLTRRLVFALDSMETECPIIFDKETEEKLFGCNNNDIRTKRDG